MRYIYDHETQEIIDTEVSLDLLRVYAHVPFHENGERIARLLNYEASCMALASELMERPETKTESG